MSIKTVQCPECGAEARIGLPRDAVVKSVTVAERPEPGGPRQKSRQLRCQNDHDVFVLFEF